MNALKNGKKAAAKLEARIHEMENELDGEQVRYQIRGAQLLLL